MNNISEPDPALGNQLTPGIPDAGDRWRPPTPKSNLESVKLNAENPEFVVDTDIHSVFNSEDFGLPKVLPSGAHVEVVAVLALEDEMILPVIKETSGEGSAAHFTLLGKNDAGKPKAVYTLFNNHPVHIGREPNIRKDAQNSTGIKISEFGFGGAGNVHVSRDHLSLVLDRENGSITVHSTAINGTKIDAVRKNTETAAATRSLGTTALIDSVPVPHEAVTEIENKHLAELNDLEEEFKVFKEQFTDEESLSMWRYAAGMMNKREAQLRGDGNGSYAEERNAGIGLGELRKTRDPERRQILIDSADKYLIYMQRIHDIRNRLI